LEIIPGTIGNEYIALKVREMLRKISAGIGIEHAFKESGIFPPLVMEMMSTGITSGAMDDALYEIYDYYEREIDYAVGQISGYIEPILTIVLGIIVLFIALAIFLPWWDMIKVFQGG